MKSENPLIALKEKGQLIIPEKEAKEILEYAGIPTTRCYAVTSREQAINAAREMSYPVALKISSPHILHKSDLGGVCLNLNSDEDLAGSFERLLNITRAYKQQVDIVIQKMAPPGVELILGVFNDVHFGPVIMLGLGGIFTEVFKDLTYRLIPVEEGDARKMIASLKCHPLLEGFRGLDPVNQEAIQEAVLSVSFLTLENPEIKELDINPLAVYKSGVLALDARMVLF